MKIRKSQTKKFYNVGTRKYLLIVQTFSALIDQAMDIIFLITLVIRREYWCQCCNFSLLSAMLWRSQLECYILVMLFHLVSKQTNFHFNPNFTE
jgi:hypothetical protein